MSGVEVSVCGACGWRGFPARIWCPLCGSDAVSTDRVARGAVEERTTVRRAPGRTLAAPVDVATVALAGGGRAVARLESGAGEVAVAVDAGAPVAREPA